MSRRRTTAAAVIVGVILALGVGWAAKEVPSRPGVRSGYAPVNGLQMYYEIHGSANGRTPPLVLLHGGDPSFETSFARTLPLLARTRLVIAFDQQGPRTYRRHRRSTVHLRSDC